MTTSSSRCSARSAFEVEHDFPEVGPRFMLLNARRLERDPGGRAMILLADRRRMEQDLRRSNEELERFAYVASHDLQVQGEERRVVFVVSDTGIGIAPEHVPQIFERFWQVDGASTRAAGGMGIGLAAAREYARLLSGDVTVESEPGGGSTFRFWLPR